MVMKKKLIVSIASSVAFLLIAAFAYAAGSKDVRAADIEQAVVPQADGSVTANVPAMPEAAKSSTSTSNTAYIRELPDGEPVAFHEVWGYVMSGREREFDSSMPITDLCLFSADINSYGEFASIPDPSALKKKYKGRIHLVITCEGRSLTHFCIDPQYGVRKKLISEIAKAAKRYDGIQIDFETIPARDSANFRSFLGDVRTAIGNEKWFSVAVPARVRDISDDIFNYNKIVQLADRVIIMAYDEHWSGSQPGPIASMEWCRKVAEYASSVIPQKKLVMGLPFYGRTWASPSLASAWYFSGVNRIMNENNAHTIQREDGIPYFTFTTTTKVTGYFEDTISLVNRCRMYQSMSVRKIAFWRIGQEDPSFWPWLTLD